MMQRGITQKTMTSTIKVPIYYNFVTLINMAQRFDMAGEKKYAAILRDVAKRMEDKTYQVGDNE